MKTNTNASIRVETIRMLPPTVNAGSSTERRPLVNDKKNRLLISCEAFLRQKAYLNTTIKTSISFFDDSDMMSEYYLLVIYDEESNTPLLSARYFFDKTLIAKYIGGENNSNSIKNFDLAKYENRKIFLADRLSGNISSVLYREYRSHIFHLFYNEIVRNNKDHSLLLMVRKDRGDKQLAKYLALGFELLGATLHKGKEHSIILGDLKKSNP